MEARVRVYRALGMYDRGVVGQVVVRQEINYLRPIRFSIEPLLTRTWFSHIGTSSFTMETQLIDEGQLAADAKSVMVCFDKEEHFSSDSTRIPAAHRRAPGKLTKGGPVETTTRAILLNERELGSCPWWALD